jgi:hypothetical protein
MHLESWDFPYTYRKQLQHIQWSLEHYWTFPSPFCHTSVKLRCWLKSAIESPKRKNNLTNIDVSEVDKISWDIHIWWACQEREIPIVVDSNNIIG